MKYDVAQKFDLRGKRMSNFELYKGAFFDHFDGIEDTRQEGKVLHKLTDVIFIVFSGVICGFDEWDDIHFWAEAPSSQEWFKKHIALANGIPSLSTIKRIFSLVQPKEFQTNFINWMKEAIQLPPKDVVSIDGKSSKGSKCKTKNIKAIHIVSALCHSQGLVIGQSKTEEKSNEITAIPELLDQLFIEGCIVSIDAMGAQKKIVKKIVCENKADYVINLKGNQETLHEEVKEHFRELEQIGAWDNIIELTPLETSKTAKDSGKLGVHSTLDEGHGRVEKRTYFYSTDNEWLVDTKQDWEKLTGIGKVIREVEYPAEPTRKTIETSYYIGSVDNVIDFATAARNHWGVESMHWSLDVTFGDDSNKTLERVAGQNLALVKRIVFNTLKSEKTIRPKLSKPKKRLNALLDTEYRDTLVDLNFKER